ncbi:MAG: NAD(P)-binding protein [Ignavibacteriae bacterium]|nr:FAD-dependent oxidoreductase [Ignavibacteriota bacterium]NOG97417.1 NAD(P)-binding protein [Ignavibacteriota bacterium]
MAKIIIIGGGFAGLTSAVQLAQNNIKVKLLEASPKLGGRAYSLSIPKHDDMIDNGQHILMGCYKETFKFLEIIKSKHNLDFQKKLKVDFVERGGRSFLLESGSIFYPFNLLSAILKYNAFGIRNRLRALSVMLSLPFTNTKKIESLTVSEWLGKKKQNNSTITKLWEIIAIGTMNTTLDKASALMFVDILRQIFLSGNKASTIVLPAKDLSAVYCEQAKDFLEKNNCEVITSEQVVSLESDGKKIIKVKTDKHTYENFDYVISSIPPYSLAKILPAELQTQFDNIKFEYSPILNIHIWLKDNPFTEKFCGLIDSKIHWIFNHGKHISLVTSSAEELIDLPPEEIIEIACKELEEYFPVFNKDLVTDYKIIKEKRATFIPSVENTKSRLKLPQSISNLFFAGDWTNTGLPSTIEGAVKSGFTAAENTLKQQ